MTRVKKISQKLGMQYIENCRAEFNETLYERSIGLAEQIYQRKS